MIIEALVLDRFLVTRAVTISASDITDRNRSRAVFVLTDTSRYG